MVVLLSSFIITVKVYLKSVSPWYISDEINEINFFNLWQMEILCIDQMTIALFTDLQI